MNMPPPASRSQTQSYTCLYSKHKTQKRKVWNDGKLTVSPSGTVTLNATPVTASGGRRVIIGASTTNNNNNNNNGNGTYSGTFSVLDSVVISLNEVRLIRDGSITDLEMEKFLVQIEGLYEYKEKEVPAPVPVSNQNQTTTTNITRATQLNGSTAKVGGGGRVISKGMQKLMSRKFKVPQKVMVQHQQQQTSSSQSFFKGRKRPLQPGEWARQCQMKLGNSNGNNNGNGHGSMNGNGHATSTNNGGNPSFNRHPTNSFPHHHQQQQEQQHFSNHAQSNSNRHLQNNNPPAHLQNRSNPYINRPQQQQPQQPHLQLHQNQRHPQGRQGQQGQYPPCNNQQLSSINNNNNKKNNKNNNNNNVLSSSDNSEFTTNEFDPSSFYGNDDESDGDDDGNGNEYGDENYNRDEGNNDNIGNINNITVFNSNKDIIGEGDDRHQVMQNGRPSRYQQPRQLRRNQTQTISSIPRNGRYGGNDNSNDNIHHQLNHIQQQKEHQVQRPEQHRQRTDISISTQDTLVSSNSNDDVLTRSDLLELFSGGNTAKNGAIENEMNNNTSAVTGDGGTNNYSSSSSDSDDSNSESDADSNAATKNNDNRPPLLNTQNHRVHMENTVLKHKDEETCANDQSKMNDQKKKIAFLDNLLQSETELDDRIQNPTSHRSSCSNNHGNQFSEGEADHGYEEWNNPILWDDDNGSGTDNDLDDFEDDSQNIQQEDSNECQGLPSDFDDKVSCDTNEARRNGENSYAAHQPTRFELVVPSPTGSSSSSDDDNDGGDNDGKDGEV